MVAFLCAVNGGMAEKAIRFRLNCPHGLCRLISSRLFLAAACYCYTTHSTIWQKINSGMWITWIEWRKGKRVYVRRMSQILRLYSTTKYSMTQLLTHTIEHSTFRPKINNQPIKKFLRLVITWVKVVKMCKFLTFKYNFLCQKWTESFEKNFFIEGYHLRSTLFIIGIFWQLQFLNHFIF